MLTPIRSRRVLILALGLWFLKVGAARAMGPENAPGQEPLVHAIAFHGNEVVPDEKLASRISLKVQGSFSEDRLHFSRGVLLSLYQNKGYWAVTISTSQRRFVMATSTVPLVDVGFDITEGAMYRVGEVKLEGHRLLRESILRRELKLETGKPFSQTDVYTGHRQLFLTGYFQTIDVTYSTTPAHTVDILIKVVENPTRYLKGGIGYGAESKERLMLGYEDRNFLGHARKFSVQGVHSGFVTNPNKYQTTLLQIGLIEPYIFNSPFEAQNDIAQEWRRRDTYDTRTTAWRSRLGRRFGKDILFDLRYRYEGTYLLNVDSVTAGMPHFTNISAVGPTFTFDNTNDPFLPSYGWRVNSAFEQGLDWFVGDFRFYKWQAKAGRFETFFNEWTFFLGTQFGALRPDNPHQDTPIFERFTLGGASTVRGYSERELGPKTALGDPNGGEAYAVGNFEMRHRLYKKLFGVAFLDGGQLWSRPSGATWPRITAHGIGDFRYGTGGGFRLHTPIGALRLELGYQLNPETMSKKFFDRAAIHFSLGEVF